MTLEEAIKHAEEVASSSCGKCAEEHKQLAEWLKELNRYRAMRRILQRYKKADRGKG